jgi:hypothetical protein
MKCPNCQSDDIVQIQGQSYCINCGKQIDFAAAALQTAKAALDAQPTVTEAAKVAVPETKANEPAAEPAPVKPPIVEPVKVSPEPVASKPLIINHAKATKPRAEAQPETDEEATPEPIKLRTKSELKLEPEPAKKTPQEKKSKLKPKKNKVGKFAHRLRPKKPFSPEKLAEEVSQALPQLAKAQTSKPNTARKPSRAVIFVPAFVVGLLAVFPNTLLKLWTNPEQIEQLVRNGFVTAPASSLIQSLVRVGIVAASLGIFMYAYRLYVIATLTYGAANQGSMDLQQWRQAGRKALGRLILMEIIINALWALPVALVTVTTWSIYSGKVTITPLVVGVALFINLLAVYMALGLFQAKLFARYAIILANSSAKQALRAAYNAYRANTLLIVGYWLGYIVALAAIWLPYGLFVAATTRLNLLADPTLNTLVSFGIGALSSGTALVFGISYWLKRYQTLIASTNSLQHLGSAKGITPERSSKLFTTLTTANFFLLMSLAAWAWASQTALAEQLSRWIVRG